jgi:hypothetical protein
LDGDFLVGGGDFLSTTARKQLLDPSSLAVHFTATPLLAALARPARPDDNLASVRQWQHSTFAQLKLIQLD